jgi:hypothetical protein
LRERREDIPALVAHFVDILGRRVGREIDHIPEETLMAICSGAPGVALGAATEAAFSLATVGGAPFASATFLVVQSSSLAALPTTFLAGQLDQPMCIHYRQRRRGRHL